MARLVRQHEWAATPLGPAAGWPQRLRGHVDFALASPAAMVVLWGPELVQIYNDGYRALLGDRHPAALGQPTHACWPEAREPTTGIYEAVLGGETRTVRDRRIVVARGAERQDRWLDLTYVPLRDDADAIAGILLTLVDTSARIATERRLRLAQELAGVGTFEWDIRTDIRTWSPEIARLYGLDEKGFAGSYEDWSSRVHPDDLGAAEERVRQAFETGELKAEWRVIRPDGEIVWVEARGMLERDEAGEPLRMVGANIDVTERKAAEEALRQSEARTRSLLAELQHRVRNTLAVVRSIAARTAEASETVEDFEMHLDGRIGAFARIQSALTRSPAGGVDLAGMIADELAAATAHEGRRVTLEGPDVRLPAKVAEAVGLALHELATNAVKHGALATSGGRIRVDWTCGGNGTAELALSWKETGVSMPEGTPARRGFGSELLESMLPYQIGAQTEQRFEPDGLRCAIRLPLAG